MIGFTMTDANGVTLRITAPHSWRELNLDQLIEIEDEDLQKDGLIKLFSIICGVEFALVAESTDKALYTSIRDVCAFVANPPTWDKLPKPAHIEIDGEVYKTPTNPSRLMHGQIELLTQLASEGGDNLLKATPRAIAIIMQPYVDKKKSEKLKYDGDRVDELEPLINKCSALDAYGLAIFFFQRLANFLSIGIQNSVEYQKRMIRKETYYSDWLNLNASTVLLL